MTQGFEFDDDPKIKVLKKDIEQLTKEYESLTEHSRNSLSPVERIRLEGQANTIYYELKSKQNELDKLKSLKEKLDRPQKEITTPPSRAVQIFLAHAKEDKEEVFKLYDRLLEKGYKPWLDKKNLLAGQNWREEIIKAIKESEIFIACLSQYSINKQGYVQQEFKLALEEYSKKPQGTIYFIPLKLDDCELPNLEIDLQNIHYLNYFSPDAFDILCKSIDYQIEISIKSKILNQKEELIKSKATKNDTRKTNESIIKEFDVIIVNSFGKEIKRKKVQAEYVSIDLGNNVILEMVYIPEGTFWMGTDDEEIERLVKKYDWKYFRRESPRHQVTIQPFLMGKYPITQAQWRAIANLPKIERDLDPSPSYFKETLLDKVWKAIDSSRSSRANHPVQRVSWLDAVEFCARLSNLTGKDFSLPSEAEWEYACRAGTTTPFHYGETITGDLANYDANYIYAKEPKGQYREKTTPVGNFPPNAFGLYDMHGNVLEWCLDNSHDNYEGAPNDGTAWIDKKRTTYVLRGGSWYYYPWYCRSAGRSIYGTRDRYLNYYYVGFRVRCGFRKN